MLKREKEWAEGLAERLVECNESFLESYGVPGLEITSLGAIDRQTLRVLDVPTFSDSLLRKFKFNLQYLTRRPVHD